jgi:hypothetical protein
MATVAVKRLRGLVPAAISPEMQANRRCLREGKRQRSATVRDVTRETATMVLKAPGILTYMLSVILTVLALVTFFFGASIPYITGQEFWVLVLAQVVLIFGCVMRGL